MHWILWLSLSVTFVSYLSSLNAFKSDTPVPLRYFSHFLLFILMGEIFGVTWSRLLYKFTSYPQSNQWFYNIFHLLSGLFYLWFYRQVLKMDVVKKTASILAVIYVLFAIFNLSLLQGVSQLNTYTDLLSSFIMVFLSIAYYYQLLHAREIVALNRDPVFWISTGLLTYNLGSMMGIFLINVMNALSTESAINIHIIILCSAVIMYLNYSIGFLCLRRKK